MLVNRCFPDEDVRVLSGIWTNPHVGLKCNLKFLILTQLQLLL